MGEKLTNVSFFFMSPLSESGFFQVPPVMLGKNFNTPSPTINLISINNIIPPFFAKFENHFNEQMVLIERQPSLKEIFKKPLIISDRKGKSLKDILVRARGYRCNILTNRSCVWPVIFINNQ